MDRIVIERRLAEAEEAYHQLNMGKRIVRLTDQNGEQIEFRAGSANELSGYIAELRRMLTRGGRNGPMTVYF